MFKNSNIFKWFAYIQRIEEHLTLVLCLGNCRDVVKLESNKVPICNIHWNATTHHHEGGEFNSKTDPKGPYPKHKVSNILWSSIQTLYDFMGGTSNHMFAYMFLSFLLIHNVFLQNIMMPHTLLFSNCCKGVRACG